MAVTSPPPASGASLTPGILEQFHPAVRVWFERRFPDGPTEAQTGGWPAIVAGRHTLVCAPTGSGKTLAGFLAAIDALYHAHEAGESIEGATQVVYLSPLKALAVDVHTNLEEPLAEIAEVARELGYEPAPITVAVRTGDSTSSRAADDDPPAAEPPRHHARVAVPVPDRRTVPGHPRRPWRR